MDNTKVPDLIVISDIHFDLNWDNVAKKVGNGYHFLNPNDELRSFVGEINHDNNIAGVVINGDSVDEYFTDYLSIIDFIEGKDNNYKDRISNWDPLYEILGKLNKPYYQNLGNHDYRKEPYSYRTWHHLLDLDLPNEETKKIAPNHYNTRWFFELGAIKVNLKKFNPLQKYNGIKTATEKKIGPYWCMFLNTGMDSFIKPKNWFKYLLLLLIEGFSQSSEGLNKNDLDFVKKSLENNKSDNTAYMFMHAPLINSRENFFNKGYQLSPDKFLYTTAKQGIAFETILNGGGDLLRILKDSEKNIILIGSHVHESKYYLIDKENLKAKEVTLNEFNGKITNKRYIKHLTTLALGMLPAYSEVKRTGYLIIAPDGVQEKITHKFKGLK